MLSVNKMKEKAMPLELQAALISALVALSLQPLAAISPGTKFSVKEPDGLLNLLIPKTVHLS